MSDIEQLEGCKEGIRSEIKQWKEEIKNVQENPHFGDSYKSKTIEQLRHLICTREGEIRFFDDLIEEVKKVVGY